MNDCKSFENALLSSIPYHFRSVVENSIKSFRESQILLKIISKALNIACHSIDGFDNTICAISIGSFGRLDGLHDISDFDILYIYDGGHDDNKIDLCHKLIKKVITDNKALSFDHRIEIENDTFDFSTSLAYPVLSRDELYLQENSTRVVQLLLEGRSILNDDLVLNLKEQFIQFSGYTTVRYALNLSQLRGLLESFRASCCGSMIGSSAHTIPIRPNNKILKLFVLREFFHIASLFSLVDLAVGITNNTCTIRDALKILSSPCILKISSFCDMVSPLGKMLRSLQASSKGELIDIIKKLATTIPDDELHGIKDIFLKGTEDPLISKLRTYSLIVQKKFDGLVNLLHDTDFLHIVDALPSDITTWMGDRNLRSVLSLRENLIVSTRKLATALRVVIKYISDITSIPYPEALLNLDLIIGYELRP
jgi:hypothetical protein